MKINAVGILVKLWVSYLLQEDNMNLMAKKPTSQWQNCAKETGTKNGCTHSNNFLTFAQRSEIILITMIDSVKQKKIFRIFISSYKNTSKKMQTSVNTQTPNFKI